MARAHLVKFSRKEHTCGKGHVIPAGEGYYWAKPGYRTRTPKIRCLKHPFRPSELTTSAASEPMSAVEAFEDEAAAGFDSIEDLQTAWDSLKEAAEEYVSEREQALEAWEHGNSQLEEFVETAQAALEEIEGFTPEEWSGDEEPDESQYDEGDEDADFDSDHQAWEDEYQAHIAEQTEEALSVAGGVTWV